MFLHSLPIILCLLLTSNQASFEYVGFLSLYLYPWCPLWHFHHQISPPSKVRFKKASFMRLSLFLFNLKQAPSSSYTLRGLCSSRAAVILLSTLLVTHACSFTTFVWKPLAMGTYSNYSKTHIIPEITCAESRFTYELNLPGYFSFSEWVKYIVSTFMFSGSYFKDIIRVPSKVGKIDLAIFLMMDIHTCVNLM